MKGSYLESEIQEQPQVLGRLLEQESENVASIANQLRGRFQTVVIAARGTSDNAARYAKYLFGARNRLLVSLATPSLFTRYASPPDLDDSLVLAISQSGQSPDVVSVVKEGRRQGVPTLALTNAPNSPVAQNADHCISMSAGEERAVAATKTYTASLTALALLSTFLNEDHQALEQVGQLPKSVEQTIDSLHMKLSLIKRYADMQQCAVIGRGFNYSTVFEISLKIKELARIGADPYSSADFLHGPIATVREGFPIILVGPSGQVFADMKDLVDRLSVLKADLILISDESELLDRATLALPLPPGVPEWLSPVVAVLPGQIVSQELARHKGLDLDNPLGLSKVTETY